MSGRLSFNTDTLPERDRFSAYCEEMIRRYAVLDILARDNRENFSARIELQCAGSVGVGFIATSPSDYVRQPQQLRDGDDALCVVLCLEGGAYQTQRGDEQALRAGEAIVCDSGRVGGIHVMVASQFWSLKIPRPKIVGLLPQIDWYAGTKLDKDPVARRLLFGYLGAGHGIDLSESGRAAALYDEQIVDLIALALGAALPIPGRSRADPVFSFPIRPRE